MVSPSTTRRTASRGPTAHGCASPPTRWCGARWRRTRPAAARWSRWGPATPAAPTTGRRGSISARSARRCRPALPSRGSRAPATSRSTSTSRCSRPPSSSPCTTRPGSTAAAPSRPSSAGSRATSISFSSAARARRPSLSRRVRPLPIDPLLPQVVAALREGPALVIEAPPGAGKTTRVPAALLDAGLAGAGEILVLQPRRLPARLAAERVAEERGEAPGQTVGYTVRFEDLSGPRTRLRFITEGILVRRLLGDPTLAGVAAVVLDEFHERHLATDLALALLRRLQLGARPDLRLVVMSATLEADPVREFLGGCPLVRSE